MQGEDGRRVPSVPGLSHAQTFILSLIDDPIYVRTERGMIHFGNLEAARVFGRRTEDGLKHSYEADLFQPKDLALFQAEMTSQRKGYVEGSFLWDDSEGQSKKRWLVKYTKVCITDLAVMGHMVQMTNLAHPGEKFLERRAKTQGGSGQGSPQPSGAAYRKNGIWVDGDGSPVAAQ
jgi:PAS domain-containing protein